jgi:serine/threonine protein kinase
VITLEPPLAEGERLADDLTVLEHLSRNQVMDVYDVWDERRWCRCVAKTLRPDCFEQPRDRERLIQEGELLQRFTHPHLVRAYETRRSPRLVVVMETLAGETISHLISERRTRLPVTELALLGLQLGSAVRYLHAEGWLHLDLKPSNVIVDAGMVKLFDLSLARAPGTYRAGTGTRGYMAPEQAAGAEVGPPADVWGFGAVLFVTACDAAPFEISDDDPYPQLDRRAPRVRALRRVPPGLGALIDACLEPAPADRPTIGDCLAELERHAG